MVTTAKTCSYPIDYYCGYYHSGKHPRNPVTLSHAYTSHPQSEKHSKSTPTKRRTRKSWFETGRPIAFEFAVESPDKFEHSSGNDLAECFIDLHADLQADACICDLGDVSTSATRCLRMSNASEATLSVYISQLPQNYGFRLMSPSAQYHAINNVNSILYLDISI